MAKGTAAATGQEKVQDTKQASGTGKGGGEAGEEQLVIRAPVHCDGCGRKLRRSLQRIEGLEEVTVDSRSNMVLVRGRRAVENATEVVQIVERKTGEKAVLVSPSPEKLPPRSSAPPKPKDTANDFTEVDMEMVTVLKMNLHCDACSEEIQRRILKITGVEEAVPQLKSSQMMVKGKVEPATLVGFVHKCTGRRAAIIRAQPLDDHLLQSPNHPTPPIVMVAPSPPVQAESKKDENPPGEKKNGGQQNEKKKDKEEEPNLNNNNKGGRGGGDEDDNNVDDDDPETDKTSDGGGGHGEEHGATRAGGAPDDNSGDGLVVENRRVKDDRLFTVPMPAGVVTVAPEMALCSNRSYYYPAYPSYAQYYYPYQQYQYPQQAYPAYACSPAGYGYGYPANYPPEAFCEENPNACTIV